MLGTGPHTRFVVTDHSEPPLAVYDSYVERGHCANASKDCAKALAWDRLSDQRFLANHFRLLLHAAASWVLDTLRRWLSRLGVARWQLDILRLQLRKSAGASGSS